jgi:hypothetical protein
LPIILKDLQSLEINKTAPCCAESKMLLLLPENLKGPLKLKPFSVTDTFAALMLNPEEKLTLTDGGGPADRSTREPGGRLSSKESR